MSISCSPTHHCYAPALVDPFFFASAPPDVLRALAFVRASQECRTSSISLLRRAAFSPDAYSSTSPDERSSREEDDPLSLCHLARLLITPRCRRRRHASVSQSSILLKGAYSSDGRASERGKNGVPETDTDDSVALAPPAAAAVPPTEGHQEEEGGKFMLPSGEDKDEARRLFSRALASAEERRKERCSASRCYWREAGGTGTWHDGDIDGSGGNDSGRGGIMDTLLAQVHLEVSECSQLLGGHGLQEGVAGGEGGTGGCDEASEAHLRLAARAAPDTKPGLTAR